jgi:S1-C subfamily serine protease
MDSIPCRNVVILEEVMRNLETRVVDMRSRLWLLAGAFVFLSCVRRGTDVPQGRVAKITEERAPAVVAIAAADGDRFTLCSGALVARNLLLTARHCVSKALTANPSCDASGRSHNGSHVDRDIDPSDIAVYDGPQVKPGVTPPLARGVRTLHPQGTTLCDADVAYLVLDRPIYHLPILPVRSHAPITEGDVVMPIGFGGGPAQLVGTRVPRRTSQVLSVGPGANSRTGAVLGPREFEVDAATCRGDSGGPAIDVLTGEIVGVVSRGASCSGTGNHVYTRVDAFHKLTAQAFVSADRHLRETVAQHIGASDDADRAGSNARAEGREAQDE